MAQALRDAARTAATDPPSPGDGRSSRARAPTTAWSTRRTSRSPPRSSRRPRARASSCTAARRSGPSAARRPPTCSARSAARRGRSPPSRSRCSTAPDVALVHAGAAIPGWDALAALRDEIGLRGPLHSAEKLVDHLGATRFVVGHTHSSYRERLQGAVMLLGAERCITVRGMEGADILRTGRPSAADTAGPDRAARVARQPAARRPRPAARRRPHARDRGRRRARRRGADGVPQRRPAPVRRRPLRERQRRRRAGERRGRRRPRERDARRAARRLTPAAPRSRSARSTRSLAV